LCRRFYTIKNKILTACIKRKNTPITFKQVFKEFDKQITQQLNDIYIKNEETIIEKGMNFIGRNEKGKIICNHRCVEKIIKGEKEFEYEVFCV